MAVAAASSRTSPEPTQRVPLDGMAADFEKQVRRMGESLPSAVARNYIASFIDSLQELREAIALHSRSAPWRRRLLAGCCARTRPVSGRAPSIQRPVRLAMGTFSARFITAARADLKLEIDS